MRDIFLKKTFSKVNSKLDFIKEHSVEERNSQKSKSPDLDKTSNSIQHTQASLKEDSKAPNN